MDIGMFQNIQQQQKLILTHEMQQSLKILQMPIVELKQEVTKELEENPLLETTQEDDIQMNDDYLVENEDIDFNMLINTMDKDDFSETTYNTASNERKEIISFIKEKGTLRQYLSEQIIDLQEENQVIRACNYIVDNLDDRGYLDCTVEEVAGNLRISIEEANYALTLVQNLQPCGIAARNLKECLKIQLINSGIEEPKIYKIIDDYLELVAQNKIKQIAKNLGIDTKKTQEYCDLIKTLEPKPSRGFFTGELESFVIPEAYIKSIGDDFYIIMNDNFLPRLTISESYKKLIKTQTNEEVSEFIKNKLNSAVYLIKGIENRNKTIYNILMVIIDIQRKYFEAGEQYLKPMIIADIASRLEIHESTVSRAIRDKYIGTPYGTVKIKDLFSTGIESKLTDDNVSINHIKTEIKKMIDNEDKSKPMSDQDICDILVSRKIEISRRTVAKYREGMGIMSSSKRKKY
ncbi:RNA polymerase factor sigma-54 [Clostridium oryzae]|uniref:RNA polymerase sigma-54 factor n=1 Tax=Clostridium oryzae TaxID=1450648 RepID=A0A1V4IC24_9CLOT|nr:RNA polymerase factor sigma-54 [Clostridium oryzae]OPJ57558.1 RNA polymerase sigma-54 factor [Clostridium oryzae]